MKRLTLIMLLLAWACLAIPAAAASLGDPAPPLAIRHWVKGAKLSLKEGKGKKIYVIEFWATWCPPCRMSIPHLTQLQKKYADKGVVIIGISDEDLDTVQPFVRQMGEKMAYTVAIDAESKTGQAYMGAFEVDSIPHAFIVDQAGKIVWHGHPMDGMEEKLDKLVAEANQSADQNSLTKDNGANKANGTAVLPEQAGEADMGVKDPESIFIASAKILRSSGYRDVLQSDPELMAKLLLVFYGSQELIHHGKQDDVRLFTQQVLTNDPGNPWAMLLEVYMSDNHEQNIAVLTSMLKKSPGLPEIYDALAMEYATVRKLEQTRAYLEMGLKLDPDHPLLNNSYCYIMRRKAGHSDGLERKHYFEEGLKAGRKAAANQERIPWYFLQGAIYYNLGVCCEELGMAMEARENYNIALKKNPKHRYAQESLARLDAMASITKASSADVLKKQ